MSALSRWTNTPAGFFMSKGDTDDPYVLSIVVHQTADATHENAVLASARGVALMLADDKWSESVAEWSQGFVRKVTRRAKGKKYSDVTNLPGIQVSVADTQVYVLPPMRMSELPREVTKLQVSGLDLPRAKPSSKDASSGRKLVVSLNPDLDMTTGKACAQAGHVAHFAAFSSDAAVLEQWQQNDFLLGLGSWDSNADIEVRDAGFTEVPPNSVTACGRWE